MNPIEIDPTTQKDVLIKARELFESLIHEMESEGYPIERLDWADWLEIAESFYTNGFINGAMEMLKDEDFKEAVKLMSDEIDYQQENGI